MASFRQIHTQIWSDTWFQTLTALQKLVFIYLFSNGHGSPSGLYEISLRTIAFETCLDPDAITAALRGFEDDGRVAYDADHSLIWVKNAIKYQGSSSPYLRKRIEADVKGVPDGPLKQAFLLSHPEIGGQPIECGDGGGTVPSASISVPSIEDVDSPGEGVQGEGAKAALEAYGENMGAVTPVIQEALDADCRTYGIDWVCSAIEEAAKSGARNLKYVEAILSRWKRDGFKSKKSKPTAREEPRGYAAILSARTNTEVKDGK